MAFLIEKVKKDREYQRFQMLKNFRRKFVGEKALFKKMQKLSIFKQKFVGSQ